MKYIQSFESLNEAKKSTIHRAAKKGSYPAVIVVVQDGKVIHQEPVSTPDIAPATFNVMQEKYPKALLHLEDNTGKRLFSESVVTEGETLKKGDIVKFKDGSSIYIVGPKGDGYDYKDGRELGHHPKGWFDMMISTGKAVIESVVTEAAKIETERYVRSHGKKPTGYGGWMFSYNRDGSDVWQIPNGMSWPDAQNWAKKKAKEDGEDYVYVMESESSVTEATMQEIDKKVQKFVIKNANDYEYSNQDSAFQIYLSLKKLYPSLIKESVVTEGAMSELDIIAKEAKDFKSFVKEFKKEFKNMDAGSPKELEAWLQTIYDSAKETMD